MNCRVCDSSDLELAIDLGMQPWCNHFLKPEEAGTEPTYPLRVVYCHKCGTAQLDYTVKKEILFGDHTYLSGITKTLSDHFATIAHEADERFLKDKLKKNVLDIGSNDGTQLKHFQSMGYGVLGVESSKGTAAIANRNGIPTINAFFNLEQARSLGRKFDLINAAGVFFHLEELHSVTEGIRESLKHDGVFIVQFLYMKSIVENCAFDQIYHEHLLYYTLQTINFLLQRHGLEMFDAYLSPIHGGSVIAYVGHIGNRLQSESLSALLWEEDEVGANEFKTYMNFAKRIRRMRDENVEFLQEARGSGKRIFGFGAPVKGNTLLNYFHVGPDLIECLVEKNELRRGLLSPGMHIPVVIENEIEGPPDIYYVLAWNFKKEILQRNRALLDRGVEFYFPVDPWSDQK
jgi:SAM-dependent methyltransferase